MAAGGLSPTSGYKIMSMNTGSDGKSDHGTNEERRQGTCRIISKHLPDIALLQECSSPNFLQQDLDDTKYSAQFSYQVYEGVKDSSGGYVCLVFNENELLVDRYDYRSTYRKLVDRGRISTDMQFPTRLSIWKCTSKGAPWLKVLVAPYHARNKLTDERKSDGLKEFIKLLDTVRADTGLDILVGGDFNFEFNKAKETFADNDIRDYHLYTDASPKKETDGNMVDYLMYTGQKGDIGDITVAARMPSLYKHCFDHIPLFAYVHQSKRNKKGVRPPPSEPPTTPFMQVRPYHTTVLYECSVCAFKCQSDSVLVSHMRSHKGENSLTCDECGMKCKSGAGLASHKRSHKKENGPVNNAGNPYVNEDFTCDECGLQCKSGAGLASHKRSHKKEISPVNNAGKFTCGECGLKCKSGAGLASHVRSKHK